MLSYISLRPILSRTINYYTILYGFIFYSLFREKLFMEKPKYVVFSDLNGTCIEQHSMSDIIRLYKGRNEFEEVWRLFKRQTNREETMESTFALAGELSKGITLRQIIEYTIFHMRYMEGFEELLNYILESGGKFVLNSTGYSATVYCIRAKYGEDRIHGFIGDLLQLAPDADAQQTLEEYEIEDLIKTYFTDPNSLYDERYDIIKATGKVTLGIKDEAEKAKLASAHISMIFPGLPTTNMVHIGDTMGDSRGILDISLIGGVGIGFNYNDSLKYYILGCMDTNNLLRLHLISKKDMSYIIPVLKEEFE